MVHLKTVYAAILLLVYGSGLTAATYYVDDNGAASWGDCEHNAGTHGPKSGADACNLATANANVAPGDTVYLREGTYYPTNRTDCIHPGQSGTPARRITYQNYNGERVTLDGTNTSSDGFEAILFCAGWNTGDPADGRSYITVRGIGFANWDKLGEMRHASHNEIADCAFSGHKGDGMGVGYNSFLLYQQSSHNWIHGNTWHTYGHYVERDAGVLLNIGHDSNADADNSGNDYNTVEDNHFYASGHHVIGVNNGKYNVVRNNYVHNEGWSTAGDCANHPTGVCGYRVMSMTDANDNDIAFGGLNLIEQNKISYGGQYGGPHLVTGGSGSGLTVATDANIVRYNEFFGNVLFGLRIGASFGGSIENNHIFNNTFYHNGYNLDSWGIVNEDDPYLLDAYRCALYFYGDCDGGVEDNVVKNNLSHDVWSETHNRTGSGYYPAFNTETGEECNTITDNWGHSGGYQATPFTPYPDPEFVDPDIADPMALSLVDGEWRGRPDLSLRNFSPAIDTAAHLTKASGPGSNSTTLAVDDARYFQDGTWGSDLAGESLHPDWIAIGTVSDTVRISSIDYNTNTIALAYPMTWSADARVWLYKKSDGEVVLAGTAPDYGANEYVFESASTMRNTAAVLQCSWRGATVVHDILGRYAGTTTGIRLKLRRRALRTGVYGVYIVGSSRNGHSRKAVLIGF